MDPLSITSGAIAVLGASGSILQGLQKIVELRHRDKEFARFCNSFNEFRALIFSIEIALKHIELCGTEAEHLRDCLGNVQVLCQRAFDGLLELEKVLQELEPPYGYTKPPKRKWIRRRPKLNHLTEQVRNVTNAMALALPALQSVRSSTLAAHTSVKRDNMPSRVKLLIEDSPSSDNRIDHCSPYLALDTDSRVSSQASFHTAVSEEENFTEDFRTSTAINRFYDTSSTNVACETFCPCLCHVMTRFHTPSWASTFLGSCAVYSNGSIWLKRRACNKKTCHQGRSLHTQISYIAPTWTFVKDFIVYANAQIPSGSAPAFAISLPRIIPYTAVVWSVIELGKISELKQLLSLRLASPYDVDLDGTSLLKYAALKGQNEIYHLLLKQSADPYMRDNAGIMAIQPKIDQVFSGMALDRNVSQTAQTSDELFLTNDVLGEQCFSIIHHIVLGLVNQDLEEALKYYPLDVDSTDTNGRSALHWAAWRGDGKAVNLLLQHGADVSKTDYESFTPLARAVEAGHILIVRALLEAKASVHTATSWGTQPIHLASDNKSNGHQIVAELLAVGANPNAYSRSSGTPLHNAANHGSLETVRTLLAHGVDIDAIGENGDTAAMVALYCWNEAIFLHLARAGARLDIVNHSGHNIVQLATWSAGTESWILITELAKRGKLGCIDVKTLHDDHGIQHCFSECRNRWHVGVREDREIEKTEFDRMILNLKK